MSEPLADQDLSRVDAYWRAAKKSKRSWSTASAGTSRAAPSNPASSPPRTMATARKLEVAGTRITARVSIGTARTGGDFALAVALDLEAPQLSQEDAAMLMTRAHERCPYSKATRGNIEVTLSANGAPLNPLAG